ncbi:SH2 domain [Legionella cherrii]|uniref:SH2 domain n=1 Tax=Legionella cherrii TaxID=28084 RepID=A0A0W0SC84_9GAMM|nr:SH2 domain-containing protein [Legionella cherrii]KTC81150.1 SH2 domain protein [Legionella cherrii]VEB33543.1 SH2 domain [Legionella cherrii]
MREKYQSDSPACYYNIDRKEAEKRLLNMPFGTFLLRPSSQQDAVAALSMVIRGKSSDIKVLHLLVTQNPADEHTLTLQSHPGNFQDLKTMVLRLTRERNWIPLNQIEAVKGMDCLRGSSLMSMTWKQLDLNEQQIEKALTSKPIGTFIFSLGKMNSSHSWVMSLKISQSTIWDIGLYIKKNGFCEKSLLLPDSRPVIEIPKSVNEIIRFNGGRYFADECTYKYSKGELISQPIFIEPLKLKKSTIEGYIKSIEEGNVEEIKSLFKNLSKLQKRALLKLPFYIHPSSQDRDFSQGYTSKPIDLATSPEMKDFLHKEEEKLNNLTQHALVGMFKGNALPKDVARIIASYLDFTDGLHISQTSKELHKDANSDTEEHKPKC